jgi:transcription elongation factor GreA
MDKNDKVTLTKEGIQDLKEELEKLENNKRPLAVERVSIARNLGDLTENSEYAAAREELAFIDSRIAELREITKNVKLIRTSKSNHEVKLGCKVTIKGNGVQATYHLVGEFEADPTAQKISASSPLGKALLGKKVGEKAEIEAPVGKIIYQVLKIE